MNLVQIIEHDLKGDKSWHLITENAWKNSGEIWFTISVFFGYGTFRKDIVAKMNSKVPWKQKEICKAADLLGIPDSDIGDYFFTTRVQNIEQKGGQS